MVKIKLISRIMISKHTGTFLLMRVNLYDCDTIVSLCHDLEEEVVWPTIFGFCVSFGFRAIVSGFVANGTKSFII